MRNEKHEKSNQRILPRASPLKILKRPQQRLLPRAPRLKKLKRKVLKLQKKRNYKLLIKLNPAFYFFLFYPYHIYSIWEITYLIEIQFCA